MPAVPRVNLAASRTSSAWLRVESFEHTVLDGERAIATVLGQLGAGATPVRPTLLAQRGDRATAHGAAEGLSGSANELEEPGSYWRVSFALPVAVIEYPETQFALVAIGRESVALPSPRLITVSSPAEARALQRSCAVLGRKAVVVAVTASLCSTVPTSLAQASSEHGGGPGVGATRGVIHSRSTPLVAGSQQKRASTPGASAQRADSSASSDGHAPRQHTRAAPSGRGDTAGSGAAAAGPPNAPAPTSAHTHTHVPAHSPAAAHVPAPNAPGTPSSTPAAQPPAPTRCATAGLETSAPVHASVAGHIIEPPPQPAAPVTSTETATPKVAGCVPPPEVGTRKPTEPHAHRAPRVHHPHSDSSRKAEHGRGHHRAKVISGGAAIEQAPQGQAPNHPDRNPIPASTVTPTISQTSSGAGPSSGGLDAAALSSFATLPGDGSGPPAFLIPIYKQAGRRYHVPWQVLAAINSIETNYGRDLSVSSAGAVGWMQFMPGTWREYGVAADGHGTPNPYDPRDAIFSAARYLAANGARADLRRAIFAYNHATWYVDEVLARAQSIGDPATTSRTAGGYALPLDARYLSQLGRTDDGVDIETAPDGALVYSITPGVVTRIASDPGGFGPNYPVILVSHGPLVGRYVYYGHVEASLVRAGEHVSAGQPIAVMGHTGDAASLGHGHIEIGFSDSSGNPIDHHGSQAWTPSGATMRRVLVLLLSAFLIKVA